MHYLYIAKKIFFYSFVLLITGFFSAVFTFQKATAGKDSFKKQKEIVFSSHRNIERKEFHSVEWMYSEPRHYERSTHYARAEKNKKKIKKIKKNKKKHRRRKSPTSRSVVQSRKGKIKRMGVWNISVHSKEKAFASTLSGNQILNVLGPSSRILFVSVDHFPVTVLFVKNKIKEWRGDKRSLRIRKIKNVSVFSFRVRDHVHWFSTRGGHLLATVDRLNKKQYLSLLRKVNYSGRKK